MDSEIAIRVATDILEEHFGPVVAAVAQVLLQRGRLRLQEVLVYLQEFSDGWFRNARVDQGHVTVAIVAMIRGVMTVTVELVVSTDSNQ